MVSTTNLNSFVLKSKLNYPCDRNSFIFFLSSTIKIALTHTKLSFNFRSTGEKLSAASDNCRVWKTKGEITRLNV